jgi:hypothetical protein
MTTRARLVFAVFVGLVTYGYIKLSTRTNNQFSTLARHQLMLSRQLQEASTDAAD